ncbi:MAG TPA: carbamoyltransferase HypF [Candidatus Bathyarchaeia archaeon]|nr:carbamoyltransferase HypF [Candidatus Bathyarchaeia archaeon]
MARVRVVIRGAVQGVGFRPFVFRLAQELGLKGWVINSGAGVFIEAEAAEPVLREFLHRLETEKPTISFIHSLEALYLDPVGFTTFEIRESSDGEKTALILPDIATCPDCLREIFDPANRRYQYPFTNCTNCGPRFTIIESLPYDRPRTTMKKFVMCEACSREYHDPADRRFHAQPNACAQCGPELALWDAEGTPLAGKQPALLATAEAVRAGQIVAVKGLGGFHLLADARREDVVCELRRRKRREEKPFALMFPSYELVLRHCAASEVEWRLLRAPESPIVLLRRLADDDGLAPSIAPRNPYLGAMLPYTPLHHLLMNAVGFPVVATSGNLSEEPICTDENEAVRRLRGIADFFLIHNRPILRHVDDSVVREMGARELVIRRARGFAPLPVYVDRELPAVLAVGAHQKNSISVSVHSQVFISQHIGDLENEASYEAFRSAVSAFEAFYELKPVAVACDMHPDYMSTQYARASTLPLVAVQHHYAHILSCMAENHLRTPVLGIAWDGSGFGPDGTVWGGEILHVSDDGFRRVAHLRPFLLPGSEKAVREPRRCALGLLYEVFGQDAFATGLVPAGVFSGDELEVFPRMLCHRINSPATTSAGRLFDGFASLLNLRHRARFEGQAAMELEFALAGASVDDGYPFEICTNGDTLVMDWEPAVRAALRQKNDSLAVASARFHNMLVAMGVEVAKRICEQKVVLSGGCFQNRYLTERFISTLREAGFQPYWHQRVPPNDGGIALGQLMAAAAQLRRE